jgi:hypothetical protein
MSKGTIALLGLLALVGAGVATQAPEIRRYLKMKRM